MNKKISLGICISFVAIAIAITFIITLYFSLNQYNKNIQDVKERAEKYEKLEELDTFVRRNFSKKIDEDELMYDILNGYVYGLDDKYSRYYSADEYQKAKLEDQGKLIGIGITVSQNSDGYIEVVQVVENSPAKAVGIIVGDVIVAVNGDDLLTIGYDEAVRRIGGEKGTTVDLTIRRDEEDIPFKVQKKEIDIESVSGEMIDDIAYIKITTFNNSTPDQFNAILSELMSSEPAGIVFDMRNNGGGLVSSVERCMDPILPAGDIAIAKYKDDREEVICKSDAEEIDIPIVVLINEHSASGAELFAASMRDFKDAELVGINSYGKGVMQDTFGLSDGGAVTITVATYETTKSGNYDGVGLKPDFEVSQAEGFEDSLSPQPISDTQLKKALEIVVSGKVGE